MSMESLRRISQYNEEVDEMMAAGAEQQTAFLAQPTPKEVYAGAVRTLLAAVHADVKAETTDSEINVWVSVDNYHQDVIDDICARLTSAGLKAVHRHHLDGEPYYNHIIVSVPQKLLLDLIGNVLAQASAPPVDKQAE